MTKIKLAKGWTKSRWREFYDLRELLYAVESLNRSNNHLEHTAKCIKESERFTRTKRGGKCRKSFMQFLEDLAIVKVEVPDKPDSKGEENRD